MPGTFRQGESSAAEEADSDAAPPEAPDPAPPSDDAPDPPPSRAPDADLESQIALLSREIVELRSTTGGEAIELRAALLRLEQRIEALEPAPQAPAQAPEPVRDEPEPPAPPTEPLPAAAESPDPAARPVKARARRRESPGARAADMDPEELAKVRATKARARRAAQLKAQTGSADSPAANGKPKRGSTAARGRRRTSNRSRGKTPAATADSAVDQPSDTN
jgi:hypothetical protein